MQGIVLVFRLAFRELRNSLKHFRILFLCLVLGVTAVGSVQSLSRGIKDSLRQDGRYILGGDIALRTVYAPVSDDKMMFLRRLGPVSVMMETRAMARSEDETKSMLVDLKGIDPFYPLYGKVDFVDETGKRVMFQGDKGEWREATAQDMVLPKNMEEFEAGRSLWGVAVEKKVLQELSLHIGDVLKLGKQRFRIRGIIDHEPDRLGSPKFSVSPRIMMSYYTIEDTGLAKQGNQLYYDHRIIMPQIRTIAGLEEAKDKIVKTYPNENWQGRTFLDAAPAMRKTVDRLNVFLTLISLTSLLIGGVGIANAVTAYLQRKYSTIASFKCIGASQRIIFWIYFVQILLVSMPAILMGVALGAWIPKLISPLLTDRLSLSNQIAIYPDILIVSALFGFFILSMFIIWPIGKACQVRTADLFRSRVSNISGKLGIKYIISIIIMVEAIGLLLFLTIKDHVILIYFLGFSVFLLVLFLLLSKATQFLARVWRKNKNPSLRMALANICRTGNSTTAVLMSMGFAMSIMVMIVMTESNFKMALQQDFDNDTPSFYFMDIKVDNIDGFRKSVKIFPTAYDLNLMPVFRGKVPKMLSYLNMTYTDKLPLHNEVVKGEWWEDEYSKEPLVSISQTMSATLGLNIGDMLTVKILNEDITAKIASIRQIKWNSFSMDFDVIFSPTEQLKELAVNYIGSVKLDEKLEIELQNKLASEFSNIIIVRVSEVLGSAKRLTGMIAQAVGLGALVTIIIALLVLQGSILSGQRQRLYDAVILKILGVNKKTLGRVFLMEYGVLSVVIVIVAGALGCGLSYGIYDVILNMPWSFDLWALLKVSFIGVVLTLLVGYLNIRRVLSCKTTEFLRNE